MAFLESLFDYVLMMFLWLLCSLPVVTIGCATCAYFRTGYLRLQNPGTPVIKTFLESFKLNFKQAILPGLFLFACTGALGVVFWMTFMQITPLSVPAVKVVILVSGFCLFLLQVYGMSLLSMFDAPVMQTMRNAVILALTHPGRTFGLFAIALVLVYIILLMMPSAFFLIPALGAATVNILWPVLEPYTEQ